MADNKKYPNSGALFAQRNVSGKRPTWSGNIELDGKLLKELVDSYKSNGEAKLSVSGWDREGRNGPWISISVERFGAWKERTPSREYNRNRDDRRDDDRGTTRSRSNDEDRRPPQREERREDRGREFDDEIPF